VFPERKSAGALEEHQKSESDNFSLLSLGIVTVHEVAIRLNVGWVSLPRKASTAKN
jgi:hypothetical protein